ncbi:MAG: hypothetical protein Q9172_006770 [Xanthocarpia lactea]
MARGIRWSQGCKLCRLPILQPAKDQVWYVHIGLFQCPSSHVAIPDERQPTCSACERLGVVCPGLQPRTTFIEENPNKHTNRKASRNHTTSKSTSHSPETQVLTRRTSASPSSHLATTPQALLSSYVLHEAQQWNLDLPPETYYATHFVSKFDTQGVPFSWLHDGMHAHTEKASLLNHFALNLAQAFFGQYHSLPQVMDAAQAKYGRHLLMLKECLNAPSMISSNDLFNAILTAVLFEMITQISQHAWLVHMHALTRIIQIAEAIMHRKRTFFEEPEWRLAAPQILPGDLLNRLVDVHIQIPGLLEDFDNLCTSDFTPKACFSAFCHVRDRSITLINTLFAWRWEWERQHGDQVWSVPRPQSSYGPYDSTGNPIYSTSFEFSNFCRMGEIGRYNSMLVMLLDLLGDICGDDNAYMNLLDRRIPSDLLDRPDRSLLSLPSDPELCSRTAAAEHVRSVESVLLHDSHVSSTGLIVVSTLNITYKALPADDPAWAEAAGGDQRYLCNSTAAVAMEEILLASGRRLGKSRR